MNRKTLFAIASAMLVGAAGAVTTTNTVCRIVLQTSTKDTLISVPLVDCTNGEISGVGATVSPTNLVMTTGLPSDAILMYKDGSGWKSWTIVGGVWTAVAVNSGDITTTAASDATFERGGALRLYLPSLTSTQKVYLFGQYNAGEVVKTYGSAGDAAGTYKLVGNAQPQPITLGSLGVTPANGDQIAVPASTGTKLTYYTYSEENARWESAGLTRVNGVLISSPDDADDVEIPAGKAFWYIKKNDGSTTITWDAL